MEQRAAPAARPSASAASAPRVITLTPDEQKKAAQCQQIAPEFNPTRDKRPTWNNIDTGDYYKKFYHVKIIGSRTKLALARHCDPVFPPGHLCSIKAEINNRIVQLDLHDIGEDEYIHVPNYYGQAHGIFVCFDVTNRESFDALNILLKEIKQFARGDVKMIIIGLRPSEEPRQVSLEEAYAFCREKGIRYIEIPLGSGPHMDGAFAAMVSEIYEYHEPSSQETQQ